MSDLPTVTHDVAPPIRTHIRLPFCWVCKQAFASNSEATVTDAGYLSLMHSHHVVPQAAGGTHGPQVTICNNDHDILHRIAEAWVTIPKAKWLEPTNNGARLLAQVPVAHRDRINYLAQVVAMSLAAVSGDPNKKVQVTLHLTADENRKLVALQRVMRLSRKSAVLHSLLDTAHRQHFPLATPPSQTGD